MKLRAMSVLDKLKSSLVFTKKTKKEFFSGWNCAINEMFSVYLHFNNKNRQFEGSNQGRQLPIKVQ
jgi:hypothetical protein